MLWLKLIRVVTIFYDKTKADYPAIDRRLIVIQIALIVVGMAFSILNIRIVYFGSGVLIPYSLYENDDGNHIYNQDVLPRTGAALTVLFNITNCLIAYTVLAQL